MVDNAFERPCYRSLDAPLRVLGPIEVPELVFIVVAFGAGALFASLAGSILVLLVPTLLTLALFKIKKGDKAAGHLRYFFYRTGLLLPFKLLLPGLFPTPYLIAPRWGIWGDRRVFLCAQPVPGESTSAFSKFFLSGRRSIPHELEALAGRADKQ